jgi:hypothetical protein
VTEVPDAREDHRNIVLVGGIDDFLVTHRTARLNDGRSTSGNRG